MSKQYVVGFMFNDTGTEVVLIRKEKPDWQKGSLNGVGGKLEENEFPYDAMIREFKEETGVQTNFGEWEQFANLHSNDWNVTVYRCFSHKVSDVKTMEEEVIGVYNIKELFNNENEKIIDSLFWLIPLALDREKIHCMCEYL